MDWQYMYLYKTDARRWHSFISEDHYQTGNMLKHNLLHTRLMRIGQVLMITYLEQKYKCKYYTLYQIEEKHFLIQCNKFAKQKEEVRII